MNYPILIIGHIIEIFIMYNYWNVLFEKRFSKKKTVLIYMIVHFLNLIKNIFIFDYVTLKSITSSITTILIVIYLYKGGVFKKLCVFTSYMVCVILGENCAFLIAKYMYGDTLSNMFSSAFPTLVWQIVAYLFVYIFTIIGFLLLKNKKINPDNRLTQYIFIYIAVQCLIVFVFTMLIFEYRIDSPILIFIMMVVFVASAIIGVAVYQSAKAVAAKAVEAEYIKLESRMKDRHFKELREQYIEYRKLRHDFYNHVKIIEELNDPVKLKEYTNSMKSQFNKLEHVSYCNNLTLDALLSLKYNEAKQNGIENIRFAVCDLENTNITDFALCTIVANLLDNAIAAAKLCEKKYIDLIMEKKFDRLIITVKNSSLPVDEDLHTTKEDKENHGFGIKNVKSSADQYDGDTVFEYNNGVFISVVNMKF